MGIFSRVKEIISANINAILDKAEDPEKLVKLMIKEIEDTLVELKAACAGTMAERKKASRQLDEAIRRGDDWSRKAQMAVERNEEDLARQAIKQKLRYVSEAERLESEVAQLNDLVDKYQSEIGQLQEKLETARKKHRMLVQRHIHASKKKQAQRHIRRSDEIDAVTRFEGLETRIDRMEADADILNYGRSPSLEEQFDRLEADHRVEEELAALKGKNGNGPKLSDESTKEENNNGNT